MARTKKLFEFLVVRDQLKGQVKTLIADLTATFANKRHLFEEKRRTVTALVEGATSQVEEQSDIQTTVMKELRWLAGHWVKAIDAARQVEEGNTVSRADVILDDGTVLLASVPSTALLELVQRADEIQAVIAAVPTLDPSKAFRQDETRAAGIFKAREISKMRTTKVMRHVVVVPPTEHHPAQVAQSSEDVPTATILEQEWSGLITPAQKSEMLSRAEELRRAFKSALQRSNATELTVEPTAGAAIFQYVFGEAV